MTLLGKLKIQAPQLATMTADGWCGRLGVGVPATPQAEDPSQTAAGGRGGGQRRQGGGTEADLARKSYYPDTPHLKKKWGGDGDGRYQY